MTQTAILFPVIAQVLMTLGLMAWLALSRVGSIRSGKVKLSAIALNSDAWPDDCRKIANSAMNQFQLPVLFYVLCTLLVVTKSVDFLFVLLAWLFVASRLMHAYVHTGSNNVTRRFYVFLFGYCVLLLMWVLFSLGLIVKSL